MAVRTSKKNSPKWEGHCQLGILVQTWKKAFQKGKKAEKAVPNTSKASSGKKAKPVGKVAGKKVMAAAKIEKKTSNVAKFDIEIGYLMG